MAARASAVAGVIALGLLGAFLLIGSNDGGPALVVYGHSYAAGHDEHDPWPDLVAQALDRPLENHAVPGDVVAQTVTRIDGIPEPDDIVVVQVGLNDALLHGADPAAVATFEADLRSIIELVGHQGARVYVAVDGDLAWDVNPPIGHGSAAALMAYRDAARRVGADVIDLSVGWDPHLMLDTDNVHPNEAGIRALADTITAAIVRS